MRVLVVAPHKRPYIQKIDNSLRPMQDIVGGLIEVIKLDKTTALVCNEEGKIKGLEGNRRVGSDIIAGTFFICGSNEEGEFLSLNDEQVFKYSKRFNEPEYYTQDEVEETFSIEIYFDDEYER